MKKKWSNKNILDLKEGTKREEGGTQNKWNKKQ